MSFRDTAAANGGLTAYQHQVTCDRKYPEAHRALLRAFSLGKSRHLTKRMVKARRRAGPAQLAYNSCRKIPAAIT